MKGFKNGNSKIRDGYPHGAQEVPPSIRGGEFGMAVGSLDPGGGLEGGEGSRCSHPGEMRVVAEAEVIFGFTCLSLVRREKLQPAR